MEGPPTNIMYSPPTGRAACRPSATIDKQQTSNRRFIIAARRTIYAEDEIAQVVGGDRRARRVSADPFVQVRDSYQSASSSPHTRSSHVWRFRISANLSPRTSASAGSGREL